MNMNSKRPTIRIDNALLVKIKREMLRYPDPPTFQEWATEAFLQKLRDDRDKRRERREGEDD